MPPRPTDIGAARAHSVSRTLELCATLQAHLRTQVAPDATVGYRETSVEVAPYYHGPDLYLGLNVQSSAYRQAVESWLQSNGRFQYVETIRHSYGQASIRVRERNVLPQT